jgi:SM-20-related protein
MVDVARFESFIEPQTLARIYAAMLAASGGAANVYAHQDVGRINPLVRRTTQLTVPDAIVQSVMTLLAAHAPILEERFRTEPLSPEPPQFLKYGPGDFFVAHQDGNTPLIRDKARFRRVSVVIYVNADYSGGSLLLHEPYPNFDVRTAIEPAPGTMVAFRSETTHEVTPVESGERYTIVSWYGVNE